MENVRTREAARVRVLVPPPAQLKAFSMLQKLFTYSAILNHFDPNRHFYVIIDASLEDGF